MSPGGSAHIVSEGSDSPDPRQIVQPLLYEPSALCPFKTHTERSLVIWIEEVQWRNLVLVILRSQIGTFGRFRYAARVVIAFGCNYSAPEIPDKQGDGCRRNGYGSGILRGEANGCSSSSSSSNGVWKAESGGYFTWRSSPPIGLE